MLKLIFEEPEGWYFWNEVSDRLGPFPTEEAAKQALKLYMEALDAEPSNSGTVQHAPTRLSD